MATEADQVLAHPALGTCVRRQAEALMQLHQASRRLASPFATQQRCLMSQAALAKYFRNEAAAAGSGLVLMAGAALSASPVLAQQAGSRPLAAAPVAVSTPVSSEPGATTASFGDWTLRCQRLDVDGKAARVCEVGQTIQLQGQAAPIAQVAIGRLKPADPLRLTAVLPVGVSFPGSVQIASDEKDVKTLDLPWRRGLPSGCFADAAPDDDTLRLRRWRWRGASQAGRIVFKDAAARELAIPLSFRGLGQALEALAKERV
jgi:invasion protein IalB